jgi:hypothetical protein
VIAELGLRHVSETKIGGSMQRGISGGERRYYPFLSSSLPRTRLVSIDVGWWLKACEYRRSIINGS